MLIGTFCFIIISKVLTFKAIFILLSFLTTRGEADYYKILIFRKRYIRPNVFREDLVNQTKSPIKKSWLIIKIKFSMLLKARLVNAVLPDKETSPSDISINVSKFFFLLLYIILSSITFYNQNDFVPTCYWLKTGSLVCNIYITFPLIYGIACTYFLFSKLG